MNKDRVELLVRVAAGGSDLVSCEQFLPQRETLPHVHFDDTLDHRRPFEARNHE